MRPRIVLWRHGQTDWNIENRFQGHSDIPLNDLGHFQASHAAGILAGMNPIKIVASDLIRAQQTAAALSALTGFPIQTDARLRETDGGYWEGKTGKENREVDAIRFKSWMSGGDEQAGTIGERRSFVAERSSASIKEHIENVDGTIVFVTHGGTVRCALGKMLDLPFADWVTLGGLSNASWSVLELGSSGRWSLTEHNAGSIPEPVFGNERDETNLR